MKRILLPILAIGILLLSACAAPSAPSPVREPSLESVKTEFESFLTYFKFKQWDKMFPMLHPDMQAIYGSVEEFAKNMELRPNLKSFSIGSIRAIPEWTCRSTEDLIGTENTYSNVAEIPTTFIYTTVFGETEMSQMIYAVAVGKSWKFFIRRIKSTGARDESGEDEASTPPQPFRIEDVSLTYESPCQLVFINNSSQSVFISGIATFYEDRTYHLRWSQGKQVMPGQTFRHQESAQICNPQHPMRAAQVFFRDSRGERYQLNYNSDYYAPDREHP